VGERRRLLPTWRSVLAVVAHPDDESFGLGAVIAELVRRGAAVHVLCFTHGEASTLNETHTDLRATREAELHRAGTELGVASVALLEYSDGALAGVARAELASRVLDAARRVGATGGPDGLLVFDDTGITGHPDHRAATAAAADAAELAALPVLAWTLPADVAAVLRAETGQPFAGRPEAEIDMSIVVDRAAQRRAALAHASQVPPGAAVWRRLELLGDREHLRWLRPQTAPSGHGAGR